jgi:uncharacterized protein
VPEVFGVDLAVARGESVAVERAAQAVERLEQRGYLRAGRARRAPRKLALVLTTACNLACDYCNVSQGTYGRDVQRMSLDTIDRALELVISEGESPSTVVFFGGEPLLAWDALVEGTRLARARDPSVSLAVITNGTLVDDAKARFLADHAFEVTLSLDGDEETHDRHRRDRAGKGSHARTVAGLEALRRHGLKPLLRATYAEGSGDVSARLRALDDVGRRHLPIIVERLDVPGAGDDFDDATAQAFGAAVRRREIPDALLPFVDAVVRGAHGIDLGCSAGRDFVVMPDGDLYPCHVTADTGVDAIASLRAVVAEIGARREAIRARYERVAERCTTCFANGLCGRSCPMHVARGGEPSDADCRWSLDRLDHAAYLADELPLDRLHDALVSRASQSDKTTLRAGLLLRESLRSPEEAMWPVSFPGAL